MSRSEASCYAGSSIHNYSQTDSEEAAAWAANSEAESRGEPALHQQPKGPGRGLFQWGSNKPAFDRRIAFQKHMQMTVDSATADQQLNFRDWELANTEKSAQKKIAAAKTVADKTRAITIHYVRPADRVRVAEDRVRIAEAIYRKVKKP